MTDQINQTQFAVQEPFFEDIDQDQLATSRIIDPQVEVKAKKRRRLLIIGGSVAAIMILLIIFLVALVNNSRPGGITQPEPTSDSSQTSGDNYFLPQIKEIRAELQAADPVANDVPFPPVDLNLSLFETKEK